MIDDNIEIGNVRKQWNETIMNDGADGEYMSIFIDGNGEVGPLFMGVCVGHDYPEIYIGVSP